MNASRELLCEELPWDSEFFQVRIARVIGGRLTPERIRHVLDWCGTRGIVCLYFLADADHQPTVALAEQHTFALVDVRMTLDAAPRRRAVESATAARGEIRPAGPPDLDRLRAVARISHRDTRFYFDPRFPDDRCDRLYETWIERSILGAADAVFVLDLGGAAQGYVSCHVTQPGEGKIGLVGLAPDVQRQGHGERLVNHALGWFAGQGVSRVQVVTQARNIGAQRLYQRCGFRTTAVQLWYHHWF